MPSIVSGNVVALSTPSVVRSCPPSSLRPAEFARLIVLSAPLRGLELVLKPRRGQMRWFFGSGRGADFTVTDGSLHPSHLIIERTGDEWLVSCHKDCRGFFVNDEPVEMAVVDNGDRLRVGRYELVFVAGQVTEDLSEESVHSSWWLRWFHRAS